MSPVLDPATMIEAAQTAVAAGDYSAAERLLREAAAVQEATLGSIHPDLAGTLNNLALVYEQTNKIAEAEQSYRRAHAIAVASLLPGHPFVATSLKNLVDFCEAQNIPLWRPRSVQVHDEASAATPAPVVPPAIVPDLDIIPSEVESLEDSFVAEAAQVTTQAERPAAGRKVALLALAAAAVVVVSIVMRWSEASPASGSPAPRPTPAPATPAIAPAATPAVAASRPDATTASAPVARVDRAERPESREASAPVTVLTAQLCSAIERRGSPDWQCASAAGDLQPGTYSFYTRLQTDAETTVEHRWYRDDKVHQVMRLRIAANPSTGYRTFSSTTISAERSGSWKVELRTADGALLQEERFVVH